MRTVDVIPGSLQRTIDSLPMDGTEITLKLAPGTYEEKVELRRPRTVMEGAGPDQTVLTWHDAAYTILSDGMKRGTFRSYTLLVDAENVTLRSLTVENSACYPREKNGQCVALYADGDCFLCESCVLRSHQDTLFTAPLPPKEIEKNGFIGPKQFSPRTPQRQVYRHCRISGDIDFIFGGAAAWFEDCDIVMDDGRESKQNGHCGFCTAASTPEGQQFGYVFNRCRFSCTDDLKGVVLLGRPWREYAKTVLLHCELGAHIAPEGWGDWGKPAFHTNGFYAEYDSIGPGAEGERVPYLHRLTDGEAAKYTFEAFMNSMK